MIGYFGHPKFRKEDEIQIPAPVGIACDWCDEAVKDGDTGTVINGRVLHYECGLRGAAGSVGHQKRLCSCYDGNQEDPEGMTKREAAIAAANYWHMYGQDY